MGKQIGLLSGGESKVVLSKRVKAMVLIIDIIIYTCRERCILSTQFFLARYRHG